MWLPALGAALFLLAAVVWTMSPSTPSGTGAETTLAAATATASAAPPPPASAGIIAKPMRQPRQPIPH